MLEKLLELYKSLTKEQREEFWLEIPDLISLHKDVEFIQSLHRIYLQSLNDVDVKVREMIQSSIDESFESNLSLKDFVKQKESMVWPILFQPPAIYGQSQAEREFIRAIFENWNPNKYVVMYCEGLRLKLN